MARRSGLGRGLSALIPADGAGTTTSALVDIPVSQITSNRYQPRSSFDEESLVSLTASIRELGVLQPVLVRPLGDNGAAGETYELIAGERRWRAAKRAGLQSVPAIVREIDDTTSLEHALVENLQREDLNPLEEAAAYQQLIEDFHLTHDQVAARVAKSRSAVTNTLRLFQLPPAIQRYVADGRLSAGHARALLGTPDRAYQERLAQRVLVEGLSVRDVEEAIRLQASAPEGPSRPNPSPVPTPIRRLRQPGLFELEELLSNHLDTRVAVTTGAKRGRVVIEFAGLEDLERVYRIITEGRPGG